MIVAITGIPGWLTTSLLESFARDPIVDGLRIRAFVHPSELSRAEEIRARFDFIDEIVPFDLGSPVTPNGAFDGVDAVVHAAAVIHVTRPAQWYRINHDGTLALARAAKAAGAKRFVFLSSNAAGGKSNSADHRMTEDDEPKPLSHYGRSKLLAENSLRELESSGSFDVVALRPSMFYGPPVPARHVDIYKRIINGRMPMVGDGNYRRSITYVDNLVQATRLAIVHPAAAGQTYYIVDEPVYTTRSIVEAMAEALGVPPRFIGLPSFASPLAYAADRALSIAGFYVAPLHLLGEADWHIGISCEKAKREIGYRPNVELREGMANAVQWCRRKGLL